MADISFPDVLESPPRLTGENPAQDIATLNDYIGRLYQNFILAGAVLLTKNQGSVNPTTGGVEAFPVGAVFVSIVDTDPAALLGYGTWSRFGKGRALVGLDETDTDFATAAQETGSKLVTPTGTVAAPVFTGSALAGHTHAAGTLVPSSHVTTTQGATNGVDFNAVKTISDHTMSGSTTSVSAGTPAGTNDAPAFTGSPASVVQPSIAVYLWQRLT